MLAVEELSAGYGESRVLTGVTLSVGAGEVVTLLGRNGMGKTTTVRAIMGLLPSVGGRIAGGRVAFAGAPEHVITGSALLAFAAGWAMLAVLSARLTSQPQRWARVPAAAMAAAEPTSLFALPPEGAHCADDRMSAAAV